MFPSKGCNPSGISHGIFFNLQHHCTVADPDLGIRGAGQSSIPLDGRGGGGWSRKKSFRPFGPQFGPEIKGGRSSWAPPLDLPLP